MINTYIAQSGTVAGTALSGLITFGVKESAGSVADIKSNAELRLRKACLMDLSEVVTITAKDPAVRPAIGAQGALSLVGVKHTGGVTLSGTLTCSAAACTVKDVDSTIGDDGQPRVVITVEVTSTDGFASGLAWASA